MILNINYSTFLVFYGYVEEIGGRLLMDSKINPIWADIIGSRNILLNRRINECVVPSLRDAIDNL